MGRTQRLLMLSYHTGKPGASFRRQPNPRWIWSPGSFRLCDSRSLLSRWSNGRGGRCRSAVWPYSPWLKEQKHFVPSLIFREAHFWVRTSGPKPNPNPRGALFLHKILVSVVITLLTNQYGLPLFTIVWVSISNIAIVLCTYRKIYLTLTLESENWNRVS
jgi:hypothetical protein